MTSLPELCTKAYYDGFNGQKYEYATFSKHLYLSDYTNNTHLLRYTQKPAITLLSCSKLVDAHDADYEVIKLADGRPMKVPEWYEWVSYEEFHVEDYGMRNVSFVKAWNSQIVSQDDARFYDGTWGAVMWFTSIHWSVVAWSFNGLRVDHPTADGTRFGGYDVQTLTIWNPICVDKFVSFKHAPGGALWTYLPDGIYAMEDVD